MYFCYFEKFINYELEKFKYVHYIVTKLDTDMNDDYSIQFNNSRQAK